MPETVILCGDAPRPERAQRVLSLSVDGPSPNIRLESEDVGRRMLRSLPSTLADLIDVATYVYAVDQMVSRGGKIASRVGSDWRRDFRFIVPVREPNLWAAPEISSSLERLLGFMSEDSFRFEFVKLHKPPNTADYFDLGDGIEEEVALFSGGLDSLVGIVSRLLDGQSRLLLVSHVSSTKIGHRQKELATELSRRFPNRIVHIPVRIRMHGMQPVERTQRTRSFLFGALAGAVAQIAGVGGFSLFENGVVSFNLPITSQVVGTAATRTTHPRVIRDLSEFLSALVDGEMNVRNPFIWNTKSDVAAMLTATEHADLARRTISCSNVYESTRLHSHCGRCSQCLDRRFGALAGGLGANDPVEMYELDLLTGPREDSLDRTMAEAFVRHALELLEVSPRAFMGKFAGEVARAVTCFPGMPVGTVADAILDLHHRHAAAVHSVLEEGYRTYAQELVSRTLAPTCILRLWAGSGGVVTTTLAEPSRLLMDPDFDGRDYGRSSQLRVALDEKGKRILIEGIPPIKGAGAFVVIKELVETARMDRDEGRAPESHAFVSARALCRKLGIAEESLRRRIHSIRTWLAKAFAANAGLPLACDALIESARWKGYRVNPTVLILAPEEIVHGSDVTTLRVIRHNSPKQRMKKQGLSTG